MNQALTLAAILEMAMGVILMIDPALVARLLLGEGVSGAGAVVGRIAGLGFLSLGLACWPVGDANIRSSSFRAMLLYNVLVAGYLGVLGARGQWVGSMLWPAVALHVSMSIILALVGVNAGRYFNSSKSLRPNTKHDSK
jgi:hypothetical protein